MKAKITSKQLKENASKILAVGYCELQRVLNNFEPVYYNAGVYGWNYDVYYFGRGRYIVTGYKTIGKIANYDRVRELESSYKAGMISADEVIESLFE